MYDRDDDQESDILVVITIIYSKTTRIIPL